MTDQPATNPMSDVAAEQLVAAYDEAAPTASAEAKAAAMMTDEFLLRAYKRIGGEPGSPEAEALLLEIRQRELEV